MPIRVVAQGELVRDEQIKSPLFDYLDQRRDALSERFLRMTHGIDAFFADKRAHEESTDDHAWLNIDTIFEEGGGIGFNADLRVSMSLPRTEDRLKLLFESEASEQAQAEKTAAPESTVGRAIKVNSFAIALRLKFKQTGLIDTQADVGWRVDIPFDPFARLRARRAFLLTEKWLLNASETVFWFESEGAGETTRIDFDRPFARRFLFRITSEATWLEENQYFDFVQEFALYHTLSDRRAMVYRIGALGQSQPAPHVAEYYANVAFRKRVYEDWLFYEIEPELRFPKDEDFKLAASLTLSLQILFGKE